MDHPERHNIDDYLTGRLSGKALENFEQQLTTDPALAKLVGEEQAAAQLINTISDIQLKQEIQLVQKDFQKEQKPKSILRTLRPWISIAATFLLIVFAYQFLKQEPPQALFKQYYSAYNINYGVRDKRDPLELKLSQASSFYKQKDYAKALQLLDPIQTIEDAKLNLMIGICQLEEDKTEAAIHSFQQIIDQKDAVFFYHSLWYLAMTHLKDGNTTPSKLYLKQIIEADPAKEVFKRSEAKKLLKKI